MNTSSPAVMDAIWSGSISASPASETAIPGSASRRRPNRSESRPASGELTVPAR